MAGVLDSNLGILPGSKSTSQSTIKKDGWGAGFEPGHIAGIKINISVNHQERWLGC